MHSLSILIPTLPDRYNYLKRLQDVLLPQVEKYKDRVNVFYHDQVSITIGEKRNQLMIMATGDYTIFCDDDDMVPSYYVKELLKAIDQSPDVVTLTGHMLTDGNHRVDFIIKLGEEYKERGGKYYRWPNILCAFKRSLVIEVKFRNIRQMEDYYWSEEIMNKKLLKTEVHIEKEMYQYLFRTKK